MHARAKGRPVTLQEATGTGWWPARAGPDRCWRQGVTPEGRRMLAGQPYARRAAVALDSPSRRLRRGLVALAPTGGFASRQPSQPVGAGRQPTRQPFGVGPARGPVAATSGRPAPPGGQPAGLQASPRPGLAFRPPHPTTGGFGQTSPTRRRLGAASLTLTGGLGTSQPLAGGLGTLRAGEAGGISLGLLPPCVLWKGLSPPCVHWKGLSPLCAQRKGLLPPARSVHWLDPQRVSSAKAIPLASVGDGLQLFAGKGPTMRAYGAFAGFAMHRRGISASRIQRCVASGACWTCAGGASGQYEPSCRQAVFPSPHGPPSGLVGSQASPGACDGELGFDSGEGAGETATTSKEGSRRANYPILTRGVGPWVWSIGPPRGVHRSTSSPSTGDALLALTGGSCLGAVTLKKLECSKRTTAKAFAKDVFINQERKLGARRRSDTVLVSTINDADQGSADVAFRTPQAPYEKSKFLGSGGSMVARLKLKGIDGSAPPGVVPAA
ncbi:hypothetical protein H6P81_016061 [Aristolochia fimbriata]|uniref:Uncharacterized protein n=1 Tax=Aristolochia fimbriata TaxID=158543 RepID=A0AAV7EAA9_ARIFI|nr:hypothetical protein H6P81_016061 [Aristolochia fimbriata]